MELKKEFLIVIFIVCLSAALVGCGKKAPPLPPYEKAAAQGTG
ncbi:MAG: hypothetical protein ACE5EB_01670 [Thermodesulfobacteriota bacterium]